MPAATLSPSTRPTCALVVVWRRRPHSPTSRAMTEPISRPSMFQVSTAWELAPEIWGAVVVSFLRAGGWSV